jgi:RNA 3'-terminal phosphate cyclase (ATP)
MITIDGSAGEGGGQILRTSLGLSLVTGKAFRIEKIRAGRKKPGLLQQHLTAVNAATEIGNAEVTGAHLNSQYLTFVPGTVVPGNYKLTVGTAGSATLVLQTVLPPLMIADSSSSLTLEGGTHNPFAPPFDFLNKAFLPVVNKIGPHVSVELKRPGFYPAGGGQMQVVIEPIKNLKHIELVDRGALQKIKASALLAKLPDKIAERELNVIENRLKLKKEQLEIKRLDDSLSPGNVVTVYVESSQITEVFTGFGERGVRAETVAENVIKEVEPYLNSKAVVGEHLADQLLIPMALARGGSFTTLPLSLHSRTNIDTIQKFVDIDITVSEIDTDLFKVSIGDEV